MNSPNLRHQLPTSAYSMLDDRSIASYFGLDTSAYGPTIESIGEDEDRIRYVWMRGERGDVYNILFTFKITGDANDFSNWELIGETEMKYPGL